jgi:ubiquinone biosynthesis O-methyltransferase
MGHELLSPVQTWLPQKWRFTGKTISAPKLHLNLTDPLSLNQRVVGSSPTAPTKLFNDLDEIRELGIGIGVPMGFQRCIKTSFYNLIGWRLICVTERRYKASMPMSRKIAAVAYGLTCHGMFVTAVGMMMFQMYFGMTKCFGTLHGPLGVLVNALLLLQFPVVHSLLLTPLGRKFLQRLAPAAFSADMVTTTYVIAASTQVLLLFSLWSPSGVILWQAHGMILWLLSILYATSWLLLGKAIFDAGITLQTGSLGWWAVFHHRRPTYPAMPTRGLFRFCRQPIYLAFTCTVWTVAVWTPDQLFIALVLTAYCLIGPLFKEARFVHVFGAAFLDYQKVRPYWLPNIRIWRRAGQRNDLSIYDTYASHWWDGSQRWLRTLQNLVPARLQYFDRLANWAGTDVLDLGCGGGFMAVALAQRGANVTGIDPAEKAIAIARLHASAENLGIRYMVGTGESLPLADQSMDRVVCVDVLEHVTNLNQVISEVRRVLRPDGLFLFDTINRTAIANLVVVFFGERIFRILPLGTHDHAKFIKPVELTSALRAHGFIVSQFVGLGPKGLNRKLDFVFGTLPSTSIMYMGHAQRKSLPN